jgi:hypothetical protein
MQWVELDKTHINTSHIQGFYWRKGALIITFNGRAPERWDDLDRKLYLKLCDYLGIRPYEEDDYG